MLFSFKQKSQDFIVEEELPFQLKHKWDAFFVYFEKRNLTTMEVVDFLCKKLNISRMTLGIAWLKDKDAITRQWISIYKSALSKLWWERAFLATLDEVTKILKTDWNDKPIWMTSDIKNRFYIRLRANKKLSQLERQSTDEIMSDLFESWVPNVFGNQRFGIEERNRKMWKQMLDWELKIKEKFEAKFKLQAYASRLFNQYVIIRTKKELELLDGDIVQVELADEKWVSQQLCIYNKKDNTIQKIQEKWDWKDVISTPKIISESTKYNIDMNADITGPVSGFDLLMPDIKTESWKIEKSFLDAHWLTKEKMKIFQDYKIFWIRRKLRSYPQNARYKFDWEDLLIEFSLWAWEYASVLIDALLKRLD